MRSHKKLGCIIAGALAIAACATQESGTTVVKAEARFGKPITETDVAPWDIDIRTSDGKGLPAGRGTVAEGKAVYDAKCGACHGPEAKGGSVYGAMVGGIG